MPDTTLEIYKNNVPFGFPKFGRGKWDSTNQPEIKVEPTAGYILFVKGVSFLMTQDFELSVGTMRMTHNEADGTNKYTQLDFAEANEILAMSNEANILVEHPVSTNELIGSFNFLPPIRCRSSETQYFSIIEEGTITVVGDIFLTVHGWQMLESDFDVT